jgi:hypothetical protein
LCARHGPTMAASDSPLEDKVILVRPYKGVSQTKEDGSDPTWTAANKEVDNRCPLIVNGRFDVTQEFSKRRPN